jgi:hypothetical protein
MEMPWPGEMPGHDPSGALRCRKAMTHAVVLMMLPILPKDAALFTASGALLPSLSPSASPVEAEVFWRVVAGIAYDRVWLAREANAEMDMICSFEATNFFSSAEIPT